MRQFFKSISIFFLSAALVCPVAEGRGRNNNNGGNNAPSHQTSRSSRSYGGQRPDNQGQRPGNHGQRPGNQGQRPGNQGQRPGNQGQRPGNQGGKHNWDQGGNRPGGNNHGMQPGNRPGNQRPDHNFGHNHGQKPEHRPNHGYGHPGHGFGHGHNHSWSHLHYGAPHRPMMPPPRPYCRPLPPPHFHYHHGGPVISTILGITIGTAINVTINNLLNRGFAVTGYSDNAVYINNVSQLNLLWPSATLFYNDMGGLTASEFMYSTIYYDMARYNIAYQSLMNYYGAPVVVNQLSGGGIQANWWGANGQFISLSYGPQYAANGSMRYYTTLSFGN